MSDTGKYLKLAARIGLSGSQLIPKLWEMICDDTEADILLAMPGTEEILSKKTGISLEEMRTMLGTLFVKGVAFERVKDGVVTWNPPRNFVQFHDATILWPDAPQAYLDLWKEYMDTEYDDFVNMINSAGIGPFMRIIPVNKAVENRQEILPFEYVAKMVEESTSLAVTDCTCRKTQKACDSPLEVCLQLNRGAEYAIKRGTGRKLTKEEAIAILRNSEVAGLVHLTENRSKIGNVICNCCPCCCQALVPLLAGGIKGLTAPSRFQAVLDAEKCTECGQCAEICPADAITLNDTDSSISGDKCIGCGLCMSACPEDAISLDQIRPSSFIP